VIDSKKESNTVRASESISINTQCNESLLIKLHLDLTKQNVIWGSLDVPATACHLRQSWAHFLSDRNDNESETKYGLIATLQHPTIFGAHYCLKLKKQGQGSCKERKRQDVDLSLSTPQRHVGVKVKIEFTLEEVTKVQRGSGNIAHIFDLSARYGWVNNATTRPLYPR
jgi:hypothetical protein